MLIFLFVVDGGGRSLGFDAWLRRKVPAMREGMARWAGSCIFAE
jgi:hypothetical protein